MPGVSLVWVLTVASAVLVIPWWQRQVFLRMVESVLLHLCEDELTDVGLDWASFSANELQQRYGFESGEARYLL